MTLGIYVHIPFCLQKCLYCDFPSYANLNNLFNQYTKALCCEIASQGLNFYDRKVDTVYIGGGTPTILETNLLLNIINTIKKAYNLAPNIEFTIEANPGTVDFEKLYKLKRSGINRISFGVQSFNNSILAKIGRIHNDEDSVSAVNCARKAGFENINIDLMYGLPGQNMERFQDSLRQAHKLELQHISVYGLKIEENTPFFKLQSLGKLDLPDEEVEEKMYDFVTAFLPQKGFSRYEISNYALSGYQSRHNLKYWNYLEYLGVGAAAYSFIKGKRYSNTNDVNKYISLITQENSAVEFFEEPDITTAMAEYVFLGLRKVNGVEIDTFNNYFKADFFSYYGKVIDSLVKQGLIIVSQNNIALTKLGMKFGNRVFVSFLPN